ncbi:unnamed protein product, partial [Ectocarpus sp. 12 AP-2014]
VHKAHLACLVARCAMVSRWAGDPTVQAAMVSCLPSHLAKMPSDGGNQLRLADLVVWFREFITVLDDGGVGGSEGSWGSRPQRLLRVIEQQAGCAQEAVQLFVSLCRGLGLRARYVACLDP